MESIKVDFFTGHKTVAALTGAIQQQAAGKRFSDILDSQGNQYVDLVMEGGGVLGIALVGYTYGLESAGIRFRSVAGTSAGAINALLLQAVGKPNEAKSEALIGLLANMPMASFQDGGWFSEWTIKAWIMSKNWAWRYPATLTVISPLLRYLGINPGRKFHQWVSTILRDKNVESWGKLKKQMREPIEGLRMEPVPIDGMEGRRVPQEAFDPAQWLPQLKIVTAELTSAKKIVLPERDGQLFYDELDDANPADFARASMSVPIFFHPFKIDIPKHHKVLQAWQALGFCKHCVPSQAVFVDGGLISNFPINLFHDPSQIPKMPTFGVKLGVDEYHAGKIDGIRPYLGSLVTAMRQDADEEFIRSNPDFTKLVKEIDTGAHHWLNFGLSEEEKRDLFIRGLKAAKSFLETFDWSDYKRRRLLLSEV